MSATWYYLEGDRRSGPFTKDRLVESFTRGGLPPDTLVWRPGMDEWRSAREALDVALPEPPRREPPPPPSTPAASSPSARRDWYFCGANGVEGPIDEPALREALRSGGLPPEVPICRAGAQEWVAASEAFGLATDVPAPPPPRQDAPAVRSATPAESGRAATAEAAGSDGGWHQQALGGEKGPFTTEQMRMRIRNRALLADDLVLAPGTDSWVPAGSVGSLKDAFRRPAPRRAAGAAAGATALPAAASRPAPTTGGAETPSTGAAPSIPSPAGRAQLFYLLGGVVFLVAAVGCLSAESLVQSGAWLIFYLAFFAVAIVAAIVLSAWMYRVYDNSAVLTAEPRRFRSFWGAIAWFVPFANVVVPYLILQETWTRSETRERQGPPTLVNILWGTTIVGIFANLFVGQPDGSSRAAMEEAFATSLSFQTFLTAVQVVLVMLIVYEITARQEAHASGR